MSGLNHLNFRLYFVLELNSSNMYRVNKISIVNQPLDKIIYIISSFLTQFVYVSMPGKQPLHYYLCSQMLKLSQLKDASSYKPNWQLTFLMIISFFLHIFANIKIRLYKRKQATSVSIISNSDFAKNCDISSMDKRALSDFVTNILGVWASFIMLLSMYVINLISPEKFNTYPYYLILYLVHHVSPFFLMGTILLPYYVRHPPLQKTIYRELKLNFQYALCKG